MEGYKDRVAKRIQSEAQKHGETPVDLAQAMGTHPSTAERWYRGDRIPQRRHRIALAEHWTLPPDTFEINLEAEEQEVRDQLDRIEQKLDFLLAAVGLSTEPAGNAGQVDLEGEEAEGESHEDDDEDQDKPGEGTAGGS